MTDGMRGIQTRGAAGAGQSLRLAASGSGGGRRFAAMLPAAGVLLATTATGARAAQSSPVSDVMLFWVAAAFFFGAILWHQLRKTTPSGTNEPASLPEAAPAGETLAEPGGDGQPGTVDAFGDTQPRG